MSGSGNNAVTKLVQRVFPKMPDFFGALDAQCAKAVETMTTLEEFMRTGDPGLAQRVRDLEHEGDDIRVRTLTRSTPPSPLRWTARSSIAPSRPSTTS